MGVHFIRSNTKHEIVFKVVLDKEDLKYGDDVQEQEGLYYELKTEGISLINGSCYPLHIKVIDNPDCSLFGFKIYGVTDVKVTGCGMTISFFNGNEYRPNENEFYVVDDNEDHHFVKNDIDHSRCHYDENSYDDDRGDSWGIKAINGIIAIEFEPKFLHTLRHKITYKFSALLEIQNEQDGPEDAEIHCKNEIIPFHKAMLMKVSDVFENMLSNPNFKESQNGIIVIENDEISATSPKTIRTFKEILYQEIVNNDDLDVDLMLFADRYNIKPIVKICSEELYKSIKGENLLKIVDAAYKINDDELLKKAMAFVKSNMKKFENDVEWKKFTESNPKRNSKMFRLMMFKL